MSKFLPALTMVLFHEGGFSNNSNDNDGGCTNLGITLKFYKKRIKPDATEQDIKNLTVNQATEIYLDYWWSRQPFADIISQEIANRAFDLHVNTGHGVSILQHAVNACTGAHLVIDNALGVKTLEAVNSIPVETLYNQLIIQAVHYYQNIVINHPADKIFYKGWINRLNSAP